jgi:hypothetical protein
LLLLEDGRLLRDWRRLRLLLALAALRLLLLDGRLLEPGFRFFNPLDLRTGMFSLHCLLLQRLARLDACAYANEHT